jgi:hypothetical protein
MASAVCACVVAILSIVIAKFLEVSVDGLKSQKPSEYPAVNIYGTR